MVDFKKIFVVGVCLFLLIVNRSKIISMLTPIKVPSKLTTSELCHKKVKCAVVYIAPWCPACNSLIPQFKNYLESAQADSSYGLVIIVGKGGSKAENLDKAREIGSEQYPNIIIDNDESLHRDLKIEYYPSFFVITPSKKIIHKDQAAFDWINSQFVTKI